MNRGGQHRGFTTEGEGAAEYAGRTENERRRVFTEEFGFSEEPAPWALGEMSIVSANT